MSINTVKYIILFAILFVISITVHRILGFYYDNTSDVNVNYLLNGTFTGKPLYLLNTSGGILYMSYLIRAGYSYFPSGHWTDVYMMGLNLAGFFLLLLILSDFISKHKIEGGVKYRIAFFCTLIVILLWADCFLLIDLTKISFLLSFSSLYFLYKTRGSSSWRVEIFCLLLFLIAVLDRAEPALLVWTLHIFYLLTVGRVSSFKDLLVSNREVSITLIFIIAVSLQINVPITKEDAFYLSLRPYQFALWDFKYEPSTLKLRTEEDSAILRACSLYFLGDKTKINSDYFKRINLKPQDKSPIFIFNYLNKTHVFNEKAKLFWDNYLKKYWPLICITLCILALNIQESLSNGTISRTSVFIIGYSTIMICIGLALKMEYHVYIPFFLVFLSYLLLDMPTYYHPYWKQFLFTILCMCFALIFFSQIVNRYNNVRQMQNSMDSVISNIEKKFQNRILVYNLSTLDELKLRLFGKESLPSCNTNISIDNGWIYLYPEYEQHMRQLTGYSDFKDIVEYIMKHQKSVVFVSQELRMQVLSDYVEHVYKMPFNYSSSINDSISRGQNFAIKFYQINSNAQNK